MERYMETIIRLDSPPPQTQHSFDLNCLRYVNVSVMVNVLAVILFWCCMIIKSCICLYVLELQKISKWYLDANIWSFCSFKEELCSAQWIGGYKFELTDLGSCTAGVTP